MQSTKPNLTYPFAAIVGMPLTKRAFLLLAVDPLLKGVVIAAANGTAKSVIGRSIGELFRSYVPFVEIPLNITEERLFGGLDVEYAISTGKRRIDPGVISRASGGILYIDNIGLMEPRLTNQLFSAMDTGRYQIERYGIGASIETNFVIVGGFNREDDELPGA